MKEKCRRCGINNFCVLFLLFVSFQFNIWYEICPFFFWLPSFRSNIYLITNSYPMFFISFRHLPRNSDFFSSHIWYYIFIFFKHLIRDSCLLFTFISSKHKHEIPVCVCSSSLKKHCTYCPSSLLQEHHHDPPSAQGNEGNETEAKCGFFLFLSGGGRCGYVFIVMRNADANIRNHFALFVMT